MAGSPVKNSGKRSSKRKESRQSADSPEIKRRASKPQREESTAVAPQNTPSPIVGDQPHPSSSPANYSPDLLLNAPARDSLFLRNQSIVEGRQPRPSFYSSLLHGQPVIPPPIKQQQGRPEQEQGNAANVGTPIYPARRQNTDSVNLPPGLSQPDRGPSPNGQNIKYVYVQMPERTSLGIIIIHPQQNPINPPMVQQGVLISAPSPNSGQGQNTTPNERLTIQNANAFERPPAVSQDQGSLRFLSQNPLPRDVQMRQNTNVGRLTMHPQPSRSNPHLVSVQAPNRQPQPVVQDQQSSMPVLVVPNFTYLQELHNLMQSDGINRPRQGQAVVLAPAPARDQQADEARVPNPVDTRYLNLQQPQPPVNPNSGDL